MIRDPFQYSDATLIIPPALVAVPGIFRWRAHRELDLRASSGSAHRRLAGRRIAAASDRFAELRRISRRRNLRAPAKQAAERAFAEAPVRAPVARRRRLSRRTVRACGHPARISGRGTALLRAGRALAIAAPHVSPFGGVAAYRAAYSALSPADAERTFVILGTSHYGAPERFGLTRKPFVTPFGEAVTDFRMVNELAAAAPSAGADGGLLPRHRAFHRISGGLPAAPVRPAHPRRADPVRILRAQHLSRRDAGRRRERPPRSRNARRNRRARRRPAAVGAGRRHGAHGPALWRRSDRHRRPGRDGNRRAARPRAHPAHGSRRRARLLGPGAAESGRSEVVRIRADLYVSQGRPRRARPAARATSSGTSTSRASSVSPESNFIHTSVPPADERSRRHDCDLDPQIDR